jgi:hypothetical protein
MLTLQGAPSTRFCDGRTRRDFLRIGALAMGGLTLPGLLAAEARAAAPARRHRSIIMVFLAGGPPHQDMVDLKPEAPAEIRGEFKPIPTKVPGLDLCEHLPRLAGIADRLAVLRTIVGARGEHAGVQCFTGYPEIISKAQGDRPSMGAVLSYLQGPVDPAVPPFVGLSPMMGHRPWADPGEPGFLGLAHAPFTPFRGGDSSLTPEGLTIDRLDARKSLRGRLDGLRAEIDRTGALDGMDAFSRQAFEILGSSKLAEALDVTKEDPRLRARYGIGDMKNVDDGGPCCMDHFLMARRLVEAGARCVTIGFGRWDYHDRNFEQCRERLPKLDMALATLIEDLESRGLLETTTVICWGEFGRTPNVNAQGGRDHWPQNNCAILAGGGLRTGQVIGRTTKDAGYPKDRPITFQEVHATLYHSLGIDPAGFVPDRSGRPMRLLDETEAIRELV